MKCDLSDGGWYLMPAFDALRNAMFDPERGGPDKLLFTPDECDVVGGLSLENKNKLLFVFSAYAEQLITEWATGSNDMVVPKNKKFYQNLISAFKSRFPEDIERIEKVYETKLNRYNILKKIDNSLLKHYNYTFESL